MEIEYHREYNQGELAKVDENPFNQFTDWYLDAEKKLPNQLANAFVLITCKDNLPSGRVVLLKEFSENGFIFCTNYRSQKGQDIAANNNVSMVFWWDQLERQIRINGKIGKTSEKKSDELFHDRSRASQIASLISAQSEPLSNRKELLKLHEEKTKEFNHDASIPRPLHWGGYIMKPNEFEFWQGGEHRLSYRFQYLLSQAAWQIRQLNP